jgi:hypothetical protein
MGISKIGIIFVAVSHLVPMLAGAEPKAPPKVAAKPSAAVKPSLSEPRLPPEEQKILDQVQKVVREGKPEQGREAIGKELQVLLAKGAADKNSGPMRCTLFCQKLLIEGFQLAEKTRQPAMLKWAQDWYSKMLSTAPFNDLRHEVAKRFLNSVQTQFKLALMNDGVVQSE